MKRRVYGIVWPSCCFIIWNITYFVPLPDWLRLAVGLPMLCIVPGWLWLRLANFRVAGLLRGLYSIALSMLTLMLLGLLVNSVPVWFGNLRPLAGAVPLAGFELLAAGLLGGNLLVQRTPDTRCIVRLTIHDCIAMTWSVTALLLGIAGTFRLNDGYSDSLTMIAFGLVLGLIAFVCCVRHRLQTTTLLVALACVTLTLLLATSLRSWYVTGKDMKQEYQVFHMALQHGRWNIAQYRDPYNACLSVTLLPVMFVRLLQTSGDVVYKFIFQLLFVACPLGLFALCRHYLGRIKAFLAAVMLTGLPTFTIDTPLITRQEMAFVFLILAFTAGFVRPLDSKQWQSRGVFLLMAAGVVLSHYSTAYLLSATMCLAYGLRWLVRWKNRSLVWDVRQSVLAGRVVFTVLILTFGWYAGATAVAAAPVTIVGRSLKTAFNNPAELIRHRTVGMSQLTAYIARTTAYTQPVPSAAIAQMHFISNSLPPSGFQRYTGLDVSAVTRLLYYKGGLLVYGLCAVVGFSTLWIRGWLRLGQLNVEYGLLSVAAVLLLFAQAVLPGLNAEYGLTRNFMQAYFLLAIPIASGCCSLLSVSNNQYSLAGLTMVSIGLSAVYIGFLPQLTGGMPPSMNLNNSGPYFGAFYTHASDLAAARWAANNTPAKAKVNGPDYFYATALAYNPDHQFGPTGILPFQLEPDSYVLLTYSQTKNRQVYLAGSSNMTAIVVNPDNYASQRNVLYSNSEAVIYK